jgi:hypothetical protein
MCLRCRFHFPTVALCVLCTGTWLNWRRNCKRLSQKLPKLAFRALKSTWKLWINPEFKKRVQCCRSATPEIGVLGTFPDPHSSSLSPTFSLPFVYRYCMVISQSLMNYVGMFVHRYGMVVLSLFLSHRRSSPVRPRSWTATSASPAASLPRCWPSPSPPATSRLASRLGSSKLYYTYPVQDLRLRCRSRLHDLGAVEYEHRYVRCLQPERSQTPNLEILNPERQTLNLDRELSTLNSQLSTLNS